MDDRKFDHLARALGGTSSRRNALRALLGGALGVGGVALARDHAAATCGAIGARCNRHAACCSGLCDLHTVRSGGRRSRLGACRDTCTAESETCSTDQECCGDLYCHTGVATCSRGCVPSATPHGPYNACRSDKACCSGMCRDGGCKGPSGAKCWFGWGSQCLSGVCEDNVCA